jgi:AcrR family transcriptional regulator
VTAVVEGAVPARRRYDSTLRLERASGTRERIVTAGCELLSAAPIRDWQGLTVRAVADRAGVNERTVYRHFANERGLRDAVMHRLEQRAGVDLDELRLDGIVDVARRIVATVASHPLERHAPIDPTLDATGRRQREALLRALAPHAAGWSGADRRVAGAMFDALWSVAVYERLAADWGLDRDEAITGITWVIGLVEDAVRDGRAPAGRGSRGRRPGRGDHVTLGGADLLDQPDE